MRKPNWNYELGWRPVERICGHHGWWVEVGHKEDSGENELSWCVQCRGAGYYFETELECYAYLRGRKLIRHDDPRAKIKTPAAALAYCRGRGLVSAISWINSEERAWKHCEKYSLCEVAANDL